VLAKPALKASPGTTPGEAFFWPIGKVPRRACATAMRGQYVVAMATLSTNPGARLQAPPNSEISMNTIHGGDQSPDANLSTGCFFAGDLSALFDASFNRFDIVDAHALLEWDYNMGGWLRERPSNRRRMQSTGVQLLRLGYVAPRDLTFKTLSDNAQAIYLNQVIKLALPRVPADFDWYLSGPHAHLDEPGTQQSMTEPVGVVS
jgi:hypothetical protein